MAQVSPKLFLLSEMVVGRTEKQSQKNTFRMQGNISYLPKLNYSGVFMAYLPL